jgi:hypothetical protein
MEHLEANSCSASQEITYLLWNLKVHCYVRESLPLIFTLSHMNRVHNVPPYFFKIYFNIILPSMLRPSRWFLLSGLLTEILNPFLMLHSSYLPRSDHPNIRWRIQITKLFIVKSLQL